MDGAKAKKEIKIKKMEHDAIKKNVLHNATFLWGKARSVFGNTHVCVCRECKMQARQ